MAYITQEFIQNSNTNTSGNVGQTGQTTGDVQWSQLDLRRRWDTDKHLLEALGFQFETRIGEGAFGEVWRVANTNTGQTLAAKVLTISKYRSPGDRRSVAVTVTDMLREVEVMRHLNHPNLVAIESIAHVSDARTGFPSLFAIVFMDLCDGNLEHQMSDCPDEHMDETMAWYWFAQVVSGLSYLHSHRVSHMDIKPDNILYRTESRHQYLYQLADFGVAQTFKVDEPMVRAARGGDTLYTSPEIMDSIAAGGPTAKEFEVKQCDIYSLGLTLTVSLIGMANVSPWLAYENDRQDPERLITDKLVNRSRFPAQHPLVRLLYGMTREDPRQRLTTDQVVDWLQSQWVLSYIDMNYIHNYF